VSKLYHILRSIYYLWLYLFTNVPTETKILCKATICLESGRERLHIKIKHAYAQHQVLLLVINNDALIQPKIIYMNNLQP